MAEKLYTISKQVKLSMWNILSRGIAPLNTRPEATQTIELSYVYKIR